MDCFHDVLALAELPVGGQTMVTVGSQRVLLCRDGGSDSVRAVHDLCPHALRSLKGGRIRDGSIRCPHHGACFDLVTGQSLDRRITTRPLRTFPVKVVEGRVLVATEGVDP